MVFEPGTVWIHRKEHGGEVWKYLFLILSAIGDPVVPARNIRVQEFFGGATGMATRTLSGVNLLTESRVGNITRVDDPTVWPLAVMRGRWDG